MSGGRQRDSMVAGSETIRVLVSACLLGERVRYDGEAAAPGDPVFDRWRREGRLVEFCPEVAGGLPVPRPPAEIRHGGGIAVLGGEARVETESGIDLTTEFVDGARRALDLARQQSVRLAVLKDRSPSCGSSTIYDGSFTGSLRDDVGVTTALLEAHGVRVFSELEVAAADDYLAFLEEARNGAGSGD